MSQNQNRKMYRRNKRDAIRHYRGFCDYINKKKFIMRLRFAWHVIKGDL